jgi:hypothetical protein
MGSVDQNHLKVKKNCHPLNHKVAGNKKDKKKQTFASADNIKKD